MCGYKPAKYVHQMTKYGHLDSFLATHTLYGHQQTCCYSGHIKLVGGHIWLVSGHQIFGWTQCYLGGHILSFGGHIWLVDGHIIYG